MKLTELLTIYANPEATDEQKQAALAAYEEANKPKEPDNSELEALKQSIAKLEAKNSELLGEKKSAQEKAEEAARKNMSLDELKQDYESRLAKVKEETEGTWSGKYQTVIDQLKKDRVDGEALRLAAALSDTPEAILPHIKSRMGFEAGENGFETFVLGVDGKRTAATMDELKTEIAGIEYLKPLLKADFTNKGTVEKRTVTDPSKKTSPDQGGKDSLAFLNRIANSARGE